MYTELVEGENSNGSELADATDDKTAAVGIRKLLVDVSCC